MLAAQDIIIALSGSGIQYGSLGGAGDYAGVMDQLKKTRSIFVMPPTEDAAPNDTGTMVTRQRSKVSVPIVLGFIVRSGTGVDQSGDVDTLREAVKAFLVGWTPDSNIYAPMNLVGFRPIRVSPDGMSVFYQLGFTTNYQLRAPSP